MRLLVLIYVPSAREQDGRRPAMSLLKEYRARLRVSRISTGWLVRFVALSVRFDVKVVQSRTRHRHGERGAGAGGGNASVGGRIATKGARTSVRVAGIQALSQSNRASHAVTSARCSLRMESWTARRNSTRWPPP